MNWFALRGLSSWLTEGRTSIFAPKGTPAHFIFGLSMFVLAITLVIFLTAGGVLAFVLIRYRQRVADLDRPPPDLRKQPD